MTSGPLSGRDVGFAGDDVSTPGLESDDDLSFTEGAGLFEGDEGSLKVSQRNTLIALMKKEFISARTDPGEWKALLESPTAIRRVLHEVFLDLVLDRERGVAYKRQVKSPAGGANYSTLLYDRRWSREETIVLIHLRSKHRAERLGGAERAFVDRQDILDQVAEYRPANATDISGAANRAEKAVESIFKTGLLIGLKAGERFEISDAIEVLMPIHRLKELLTWLLTQRDLPAEDGSIEHGDTTNLYTTAFVDEDLLDELGNALEADSAEGWALGTPSNLDNYDVSGDAA